MEKAATFRGTGDQLLDPITVHTGLLVLGATARGDAHFAVEVRGPDENGPRELLVNTLGFYAGGRVMPVKAGSYRIQIESSGEWELFVEQPVAQDAMAPPIERDGTGDLALGPFLLPTRPILATVTHRGASNVMVSLLAVDGAHRSLLANEIGEYHGATRICLTQDGMYFVDVRADGDWTLSIK